MKPRYSGKEIELFESLGFSYNLYDHVEPPAMYRMLVEHCFLGNVNGLRANSVRNCVVAMQKGSPFRLTPEFNNLIQLEAKSDTDHKH